MNRATIGSLLLVGSLGLAACSSGYGYGGYGYGCSPCAAPCPSPCAAPCGAPGSPCAAPRMTPATYSAPAPAPAPAPAESGSAPAESGGATTNGSAGPAAPVPPPPSGSTVTIQNHAYEPSTLTVYAGTKVTWLNRDSAAHTATGTGFDVEIPANGEGSHTFMNPGTFDVRCRYHPTMHGQLVVRPPEVR